ncbi:DUF6089 family protein [Crocinitomix sp.]|nr:DUF6089 family protein [Crocinitomix sp.]
MRVIFLLILAFGFSISFGQGFKSATEVGVYGGGSYYIGDLNSTHFKYSKFSYGGIFRYNLSTRHSLRLTAFYGEIYGDDANSKDPFQLNRNLNFKTNLLELAIGFEIDWFKYRINDMKYPISPYFFYQFAYARINPMTELDGNEIALQPLSTEGQGTGIPGTKRNQYRLNQFTVPLGIGLKFNLRARIAMSFEYGIRLTFTDYLDDVSGNYLDADILSAENGPLAATLANRSLDGVNTGLNRGNSSTKDWYAFYGVMLTFKPFKKDICDMRGWR